MHDIERLDTEWRNNQSPDLNAANLQLHTDKINEVIEGMEELELELAELPSQGELNDRIREARELSKRAAESSLKSEGFAVGQQNGADVDRNSKYYHNNAEWYSKLAMSGTPEGYQKLVEDVDTLQRDNYIYSDHGTKMNLDTGIGGILINKIEGKSVQNGSPTPANPIPIINVGDSYRYDGANALDYGKAYPKTGSMTGKVDSDRYNCLKNMIQLKAGDSYKIEFDSRVNIGVHTYDTRELSLWAEYYAFETFTANVQYDSYVGLDIEKEYAGKILVSVNGKYVNMANDFNVVIAERSKNVLPRAAQSAEGFEILDDGKIHIFGNFTGNHIFKLSDGFMMEKGWYIISGVPEELRSKILIDITINDNTHIKTYSPFSLGQNKSVKKVDLVLNDAGEVDFILEPMIEQVDSYGSAATEYVPYDRNTVKIPLKKPLRAVGDVKDVIKKIDGLWKAERHIDYINYYNGERITTPYLSTTGALTIGAGVLFVAEAPTYEVISDQEVMDRLVSYRDKTIINSDYEKAELYINYGNNDATALGIRGENAFDLADHKQTKLNDNQMAAVDSGITSVKVSSYDKAVTDISTINTNLSQLSDDVDELSEETTEIKSDLSQFTATGRSLDLDTEVGGIVVNEIVGNSEQGENPSPTNPQPIKSSGDDGININIQSKNMIRTPYTFSSGITNGIEYSCNYDGSINIKGTATATVNIRLFYDDFEILLDKKVYAISGFSSQNPDLRMYVRFAKADGTTETIGNRNANFIVDNTDGTYTKVDRFLYQIASGKTINACTVYPQFEVEQFTPYVPYSHKVISLPLSEPLRSVGDKHDRIVKKDGKWFVERNIGQKIYNGSENWTNSQTSVANKFRKIIVDADIPSYKDYGVASGTFGYVTSNQLHESNMPYNAVQGLLLHDTNHWIQLYSEQHQTLDSWKEHLATTNLIVHYRLTTPVYEEITDQTALYLLESYADKTYISTADGLAELNVNYGKSDAISLGLMGYNAFRLAENQLA